MNAPEFWAGGSAVRWFVKRRRPSPFVGHPEENIIIWVFRSADYQDREQGAARDANLLAERLNA
jgi:hypothetical protein